jgi:hypothetical protein
MKFWVIGGFDPEMEVRTNATSKSHILTANSVVSAVVRANWFSELKPFGL